MTRKSNFELLRIISMLMIVGLHYFNASMGGALAEQVSSEFNYYITYFSKSFFIVGINTFILITGYFQIYKDSIKLTKVINLLITMIFYGVLFYSLSLYFGWISFDLYGLIHELFPIFFGLKWFIKTYIILYLLIPFLNVGLNAMDKIAFKKFLIMSLILFSIYPSFFPSPPVTDRGYGIITFILMYSIGGYIRIHFKNRKTRSFYLIGYILCAIMTFIFSLNSFEILYSEIGNSIVWGYNFIFSVLGSVFLFLFFSKCPIQSSTINYFSKYVLGVYFVHTSPLIYDFLYTTVLSTHKYWHSPWFIIHLLISIVGIYTVGTVIDIPRKYLFDKIGESISPFFKKYSPFLYKDIP